MRSLSESKLRYCAIALSRSALECRGAGGVVVVRVGVLDVDWFSVVCLAVVFSIWCPSVTIWDLHTQNSALCSFCLPPSHICSFCPFLRVHLLLLRPHSLASPSPSCVEGRVSCSSLFSAARSRYVARAMSNVKESCPEPCMGPDAAVGPIPRSGRGSPNGRW